MIGQWHRCQEVIPPGNCHLWLTLEVNCKLKLVTISIQALISSHLFLSASRSLQCDTHTHADFLRYKTRPTAPGQIRSNQVFLSTIIILWLFLFQLPANKQNEIEHYFQHCYGCVGSYRLGSLCRLSQATEDQTRVDKTLRTWIWPRWLWKGTWQEVGRILQSVPPPGSSQG